MKKLSLILFVVVLGLGSFAQKQACSAPGNNFMVAYRGSWGKFDYALVSNVTTSTASSNIIQINQGGPAILFSYLAFCNTTPCYTLGFVRATITVYNSNHQAYKAATVQLNNLFYYDYPLNWGTYVYCEYYIPNTAWSYYQTPIEEYK